MKSAELFGFYLAMSSSFLEFPIMQSMVDTGLKVSPLKPMANIAHMYLFEVCDIKLLLAAHV